MDVTGFTLTDFAFPVSPAEMDGFTIAEFSWISEATVPSGGGGVTGNLSITPSVTGRLMVNATVSP